MAKGKGGSKTSPIKNSPMVDVVGKKKVGG
jgi:hypothetical protein